MIDSFEQINKSEYLFLTSIEEFSGNNLRLNVQEGRATGALENIEVAGTVVKDVQPVLPYVDSIWEFVFERYVAYSVRNESYVSSDADERWVGHLFRTYSKSKFLDYVRVATFACDEYPGKLGHYQLVCTDHIIDVVTIQPPAIHRVESVLGAG